MSIELSHNVNFDDSLIVEWVSNSNETKLDEPGVLFENDGNGKVQEYDPLVREGFSLVSGSLRNIAEAEWSEQKTWFSQVWQCVLIEKTTSGTERRIRQLEVQVPAFQNVIIGTKSVLYISDTASSEAKNFIETAYSQFSGNNPIIYMATKLTEQAAIDAGVTNDLFHVALRYFLEKSGDPVPDQEYIESVKNIYNSVKIYDNPSSKDEAEYNAQNPEGEWFVKRRIFLRFEHIIKSENFVPPVVDPAREIDGLSNLNGAIDKLVKITKSTLKCDGEYQYKKRKILELIEWPEFKVTWEAHDIKIGCVRVRIWLPKLWLRKGTKVLYAIVMHSIQNFDKSMEQMIVKCAGEGAIIGSVVGIVLLNFAAALIAFETAFSECIKRVLPEHLACLAPDLIMVTENTNWSAV